MGLKDRILIADDSEMNQELLTEILGDKYDYLYAGDGVQVVEQLNDDAEVDLILLDINMPRMDGFEVLRVMNERRWIEEIPVIVISAEYDAEYIQRAYDLGTTDYINRPFSVSVVQHRVENTLMLYSRQRRLVQLVEEQVYDREKINNTMINILSHVIESRNNESGSHTLHMRSISNLILHHLTKITDRYPMTESDISMITMASALHDIGKITIPKAILNKPGKLTAEEWEIMKTHAANGDEVLNSAPVLQSEPLVQAGRELCRWRHERWGGGGYPDGVSGDEIPISAQVVALADVYDALTSERCYKKAFSHERAIEMICNGECGAFNPLLIECLQAVADKLQWNLKSDPSAFDYQAEAQQLANEMLNNKELPLSDRSRRLLINERTKKEFFAGQCQGVQFEYDHILQKVIYHNWYEDPGEGRKVLYISEGDDVRLLSREDWDTLKQRINSTTPEEPTVTMQVLIPVHGEYRWHRLTAKTIWPLRGGDYISALGQFIDIHDQVTRVGLRNLFSSGETMEQVAHVLRDIFGVVRLVDPAGSHVLEVQEDGQLVQTDKLCYDIWGRGECCENCSSLRALKKKNWLSKLEIKDGKFYSVLSKYVRAGDRDCVLEIAFCMDESGEQPLHDHSPNRTNLLLLNFYRDSLTRVYSRMYLDDFLPNLEQCDGVALVDVDRFKHINDTYGHPIGDIALKHVAKVISSCLREEDVMVRYGGDEFLLLFSEIPEPDFYAKLQEIRAAVRKSQLEDYPQIQLDVSLGGAYRVYPLSQAITKADKEMYKNKSAHQEGN